MGLLEAVERTGPPAAANRPWALRHLRFATSCLLDLRVAGCRRRGVFAPLTPPRAVGICANGARTAEAQPKAEGKPEGRGSEWGDGRAARLGLRVFPMTPTLSRRHHHVDPSASRNFAMRLSKVDPLAMGPFTVCLEPGTEARERRAVISGMGIFDPSNGDHSRGLAGGQSTPTW